MSGFDDPQAVALYADGPPRLVPGFHDLQRMTRLLLAEAAPVDGRILVVGAGGGLEMKAFADAQPQWRYVGVDPSAEMLKLAERTLGRYADRAVLHEGYVSSAPAGPFDGACCLLTMHFVPAENRLATLRDIQRRLKPGAPLVIAHHSIPNGPERMTWLERFAAYAADNGAPMDKARALALGEALPILSPDVEVDLLRSAGFSDPQLFYAAFTFRGWVGYAKNGDL
ncbi:class I SAM-dependent methyltransferase [Brevundimonas sp. PAMC22021]|uniref:class I SAM-dependent methyltransferase n=1 Tax=Brevundimonas sp. PAMC22021 TaxID=2861285 RepID=UPI001C62DF56|nr:class I SAM-dependent methyltransferase [Brevundimonas sp. PAMC22021]QYF86966.1 class I SAM-dependent methyltransferase [Brevundimonas sp. PAMC22021]